MARPLLRRSLIAPALMLAILLASAPVSAASHPAAAPPTGPQFFLSWYHPWGQKGASLERIPSCRDTSSADTLFLCLKVSDEQPAFCGFTGDLYFHAQAPETLGTYWHFEHGTENQSGLAIRYQPVEGESGIAQPWRSIGVGVVAWLHTPVTGHLKMAFAVDSAQGVPLRRDSLYTLARIAIHAHVDGLTGCAQGVAIELGRATFAARPGSEYVVQHGGSRWLLSGSQGLKALAAYSGVPEKAARRTLHTIEAPEGWTLEQ